MLLGIFSVSNAHDLLSREMKIVETAAAMGAGAGCVLGAFVVADGGLSCLEMLPIYGGLGAVGGACGGLAFVVVTYAAMQSAKNYRHHLENEENIEIAIRQGSMSLADRKMYENQKSLHAQICDAANF